MNGDYELRLRIDRVDGRSYRISATSPAGEYDATFTLPFDDKDLQLLFKDVQLLIAKVDVGRPRVTTRRIQSSQRQLVTDFGAKLFKAVFAGPIDVAYRVSCDQAHAARKPLRVTLALTGAPELMNLPWEYLYDDPDFVAMSMSTPLVRHLDTPRRYEPLKVELPLRILAMVSQPVGLAKLDASRERETLERALAGLKERGAVAIEWLEEATLHALLRKLQRGPFHVFHYIGHGEYDAEAKDGVLVLEDADRNPHHVTGRDLGQYLAQHSSLRLAVINACEGARNADDDPFAGVATSLVRRGIPAVVAMQFEITDSAAVTFASEFYWKLADCGVVDTALAYSRLAIFANNEIEWATPVLFMRSAEGRIFDVPDQPLERPPPPPSGRRLRTLLAGGAVVLAAAAVALAFLFFEGNGPTSKPIDNSEDVQPPTPPPPPRPPAAQWSLLTAIPASVSEACAKGPLHVPGDLEAKVKNGPPAHFAKAFICNQPEAGLIRVQYSQARSLDDLNRYFSHRANSASLGAFAFQGTCGSDRTALNAWRPDGPNGHELLTSGQGLGRVLCYEKDGASRVEWSDPRRLVYGYIEGTDRATVYSWWSTRAGPDARCSAKPACPG